MWKNRREQELRVEKLEDLIDTLRRFRRGQEVDRTTAEGKRVIEHPEEMYGDLTVRSLPLNPGQVMGQLREWREAERAVFEAYPKPSDTIPSSNLDVITHQLILNGRGLTSLPSRIGNLTSLWFIQLGSNNLTTLPPEIGNLSNLETLVIGEEQQMVYSQPQSIVESGPT